MIIIPAANKTSYIYLSSTQWSCSIVPNYELQSFLGSRAGFAALSSYELGVVPPLRLLVTYTAGITGRLIATAEQTFRYSIVTLGGLTWT